MPESPIPNPSPDSLFPLILIHSSAHPIFSLTYTLAAGKESAGPESVCPAATTGSSRLCRAGVSESPLPVPRADICNGNGRPTRAVPEHMSALRRRCGSEPHRLGSFEVGALAGDDFERLLLRAITTRSEHRERTA